VRTLDKEHDMQPRTSKPALTPELLALLTSLLREQQQFRQEQIMALADPASGESGTDAEVNSVLRRGAFAALAEIDAALARMARGTYGRCTACGADITLERLEAIPQTALCVTCGRTP
jgi:RNA polymerase-binding transcription factor DksA